MKARKVIAGIAVGATTLVGGDTVITEVQIAMLPDELKLRASENVILKAQEYQDVEWISRKNGLPPEAQLKGVAVAYDYISETEDPRQVVYEKGRSFSDHVLTRVSGRERVSVFYAGDTFYRDAQGKNRIIEKGATTTKEAYNLQTRDTLLQRIIPKVQAQSPLTSYSDSGDGTVDYLNGTNWNTMHNASAGTHAIYTTAGLAANRWSPGARRYSASLYDISRTFVSFNTNIGSGSTITSVTLQLYSTGRTNLQNTGTDYITVVEGTQASTSTLSTADWNNCGDAATSPTEWANQIDVGSITVSSYNTWTFNATGIAAINKTGTTKMCIRLGDDMVSTDPYTSTNGNWATFNASEATGLTQDPILTITYTTGGGGGAVNYQDIYWFD